MNISGRNRIIYLKNIQKFSPICFPEEKSNAYERPIKAGKITGNIYFFIWFIRK
jgi:hypothetical protein